MFKQRATEVWARLDLYKYKSTGIYINLSQGLWQKAQCLANANEWMLIYDRTWNKAKGMEFRYCDEFYMAGYLVKLFHVDYHSSYLVIMY